MTVDGRRWTWTNPGSLHERDYSCGHCGRHTGTALGYYASERTGTSSASACIYICTFCNRPTYFEPPFGEMTQELVIPGATSGNSVEHLPPEIEALYEEVRRCIAASAFTSAVLSCRKLLMHIAVAKGAKEGSTFAEYVDHLAGAGFVPPGGDAWVDSIRRVGNEANHEVVMHTRADAEQLLAFVEMLLKFIFEFPARVSLSGS